MTAEVAVESESVGGRQQDAEAESPVESGGRSGLGILHLRRLTAAWEDVQRTRLSLAQRGLAAESESMAALETRLGRKVKRVLTDQPVWPWLSQYPGLTGVHAARLVTMIGDPWRFPGRLCAEGHHHPHRAEAAVEGARMIGPVEPAGADRGHESESILGICGLPLAAGGDCDAPLLPPRSSTGTRSLWHYLGLHPGARRRKGVKADWNIRAKTVCLMPGGLADQIVRQRPEPYRTIYDDTKARLTRERGTDDQRAIDVDLGPAPLTTSGAEADGEHVVEVEDGLRPFQVDAIARKKAVKAFVADLLTAMKAAT